MTRTRLLVALLASAAAAPVLSAQVKYPPRAEKVDVQIRYQLPAQREERARQFRVLDANLKNLKFVAFPREDAELDIIDPTADRFEGTMPSASVLDALADPRVKTILFAPAGYKYPDNLDAPVPIRLGLASGLPPPEQQRLHAQVVARLGRLGFREAIGYDTHAWTWARGDIPVRSLPRLLRDLRREPSGWLLPDAPPELLPPPIRDFLPVRWVEVVPDGGLTFLAPPPLEPELAVFTPDLRERLRNKTDVGKPLRVEVVLDALADDLQVNRLRNRLQAGFTRLVRNPQTDQFDVVAASVEGAIGHVVTIALPPSPDPKEDLMRLVEQPGTGIVNVRLPRAGFETVALLPAGRQPEPPAAVLAASRFDRMHQLGYRGKGTRVVVIVSGFPGIDGVIGKELPADTRVIDLTAELTPHLDPLEPFANRLSGGIAAAEAAHLAAPDAHLTLVRIDPTALYQVLEVARYVSGDAGYTQALQSRITELSARADELRRQYLDAVARYQKALADPGTGLPDDPAKARRDAAKKALDAVTKERDMLAVWINRVGALHTALKSLNGANVVVNTLTWENGYRLDGLSDLSQILDQTFAGEVEPVPVTRSATRPRFLPRPVWVQAASDQAGSVWGGPYLDVDHNGVMEFAPPEAPIPVGGWTRELNFLGSRNRDGAFAPELPAMTRVRLTVQWREPHDPAVYAGRDPVAPLHLRVFRQLDPEGKVRASDELLEVARSLGGPYRIAVEPTYGVYEQIVEFDVPEAGVYCLRVEGTSGFDPVLPALKSQLEINPRMTVEYVDAPPEKGRPVFASYAPRAVGVGIPGDAKSALTIGAAEKGDGTLTTGLTGGGTGVALLVKPDLLVPGGLDTGLGVGGPGVSAGFGGGAAAVLVGGGLPPADLMRATGMKPGGLLVLPEPWLRLVPGRK
jgi:hypothetical protein